MEGSPDVHRPLLSHRLFPPVVTLIKMNQTAVKAEMSFFPQKRIKSNQIIHQMKQVLRFFTLARRTTRIEYIRLMSAYFLLRCKYPLWDVTLQPKTKG